MLHISQLGRVLVPVADQDEAIAFYTDKLGFTVAADVPFGEGSRWVEVAPPGGGANIALTPPQGAFTPGRMTGISLSSRDVAADHSAFTERGVDADELLGGDGEVPLLFFFRDNNGNQLMVAEGG
jgi:catechol 2,3-dioxygenase-like lactoylglutathione lyase family enzyme